MSDQHRGAPLRVLIADDNPDSVRSLAILLELWGHEPIVAYDGTTALQLAQSLRPHVVVLDLGMPGLSGFDVARNLRARRGEVPIILAVTGFGDQCHRDLGRGLFHDYLVKPVEPDEIQLRLARLAAMLPRGGIGSASN